MGLDPITAAIDAVGGIVSSGNTKSAAKASAEGQKALAKAQKVTAREATKIAELNTKTAVARDLIAGEQKQFSTQSFQKLIVALAPVAIVLVFLFVLKRGN